ncbi:unnamed protein product, partial [Dracunculus medinensis]|uniref:Protein kinase domain-containing protein n=1 Tax=Dracunculus medinensis TaxID=318479 RepID=A0A0N4U292_DRAME
FFPVGTEVSAKFKGAFCIARVKRLIKSIRCKVFEALSLIHSTNLHNLIAHRNLICGSLWIYSIHMDFNMPKS